ncbi:MAG: hypothetical protein KGH65_02640 [Candidatus Micrarchaeota archaeon]|nr:hypothetical protein [Candidatus Micrarchaeota archaeon]
MIENGTIANVYSRLEIALGGSNIIIVGGAAVKLIADPSRKLNDIDILVALNYSEFLRREKQLGICGFELRNGKIITLFDKENKIEIDLGYKKDFGIKGQILGNPNKEVHSTAVTKTLKYHGGTVICRIMAPAQLLRMKVALLLYRKSRAKRNADKKDIISILKKFY